MFSWSEDRVRHTAGPVFKLQGRRHMSAHPSFDSSASLEAAPAPPAAIRSFQDSIGAVASGAERRRYARVPLTLKGRFMLEDGSEFACETQDVSPIGIAIRGSSAGAIGDRVVAYFDELGRVEGRIVRRALAWFAIDITGTPRKLESLANKISRLVEREATRGTAC
jgi:PilZ domain